MNGLGRPVGLLGGQEGREERQDACGGVALDQRVVAGGGQAEFGPQAADRPGPGAGGPHQGLAQGPPERRPEAVQGRGQVGDAGDRRRVVGREEAHRRDLRGDPGDARRLGHQPGGVGDRVRDQQVRTPALRRRRRQVLEALPDRRQDHLAEDAERPPAVVHDPAHRHGVARERGVGPQRPEPQPQRLDLAAVALARRHHRLMAPRLEPQGDREVRVQVPQRADRREDDPLARPRRRRRLGNVGHSRVASRGQHDGASHGARSAVTDLMRSTVCATRSASVGLKTPANISAVAM